MRDEDDRLIYLAAGPVAAMVLGVALIPLREVTSASNLTFVFLAWTVVVGQLGGRWPAVATALTSALSLDFFLTRPYMRLEIDSKHDIIAFFGLAFCGLVAAALGARRGPTATSRRQNAVLDDALRQLGRPGPTVERLQSVLERLVGAFPLAAVSVRDHSGRLLASRGQISLVERTPETGVRVDDLAGSRGGILGSDDQAPPAGLRVRLMDEHRIVGSLDVWRGGSALTAESLRLLAAVARVLAALLALDSLPAQVTPGQPESVESGWTRPGRGTPE